MWSGQKQGVQKRLPYKLATVAFLAMRFARARGRERMFLPSLPGLVTTGRSLRVTLNGVFHPRANSKLQASLRYACPRHRRGVLPESAMVVVREVGRR